MERKIQRNCNYRDQLSDKIKILFIGLAENTNIQSWISLLNPYHLNIIFFPLSSNVKSENWWTRIYVNNNLIKDKKKYSTLLKLSFLKRRFFNPFETCWQTGIESLSKTPLEKVVQRWKPDIIHTFGLFPAGLLYNQVRETYKLSNIGKWVLQLNDNNDFMIFLMNTNIKKDISIILKKCDQLISDNEQIYRTAQKMGVTKKQISSLGAVPRDGGIEVEHLLSLWKDPPSKRRNILWTKAYDCPWSKGLSVLEALKISWRTIQPCKIYMLSSSPDIRQWYWTLPHNVRRSFYIMDSVSHPELLELMLKSRIMIELSLIDGIPNTMYEAMATGTLPIVSPLETIKSMVKNEKNVIFARNLYPNEIANAIYRAMTDNDLIDGATKRNKILIRKIADRPKTQNRIIKYYESLIKD